MVKYDHLFFYEKKQLFTYNEKAFWIGIVNGTVIFITPEENEGRRRVEWTNY